jgi:hypothetical protein
LFVIRPEYQVAICREHRSAVIAKSIVSHVAFQHRYIIVRNRQNIIKELCKWQQDGALAADIKGIQFSDGIIPAIPKLPIWSDSK